MDLRRKVFGGLRKSRHWLAGKHREVPLVVSDLRRRFASRETDVREGGVRPKNVVWIFGSGRSGSTWLRSMMGEMNRHRVWEEPLVGQLFGNFYERAAKPNLRDASFIMGDPIRRGWMRSIRNFVLDGAHYAHPDLRPDDYLVVKEPNGSVGAPLLMEALPESRMILLARDPRDVVASTLDGAREGNWLYEWRTEGENQKRKALPGDDPDAFVRQRANAYARAMTNAKKAYDNHNGPKVLVKYEDLRSNTLETMRRLYSTLEIPVDEEQLARAVHKHDWENIPDRKKGEGKFYRKATPGGWREDLTPKQARIVERITEPFLEAFYR